MREDKRQSNHIHEIIILFQDVCEKEIGIRPVASAREYAIVKRALKLLSVEEIRELIQEYWVGLCLPDEETIQLSRALSNVRINCYKVWKKGR